MSDFLAMASALLRQLPRVTGGNGFDRWIWTPLALSIVTLTVLTVLAFLLLAFTLIQPYSSSPFPKQAIQSIFDGKTNPLQNPKLEIECWGFDCNDVLPYLPAATHVECVSDFLPVGACCPTDFGDVTGSEIHIWWKGSGRYELTLSTPGCPNPEFDPASDFLEPRWVSCGES